MTLFREIFLNTWSTAINRGPTTSPLRYILYKLWHGSCGCGRCCPQRVGGAGKIVRLQSNESEAENRAQCTGTTTSCIQRDGWIGSRRARSQKPSKEKEKSKVSLHIWRTVMGSFFRWPRQTMWLSKFHISTGCIRRYWHVFTQNPLFVCMLLKFEPFSYRQDVPSISVRITDAAKKSTSW